MRHALTLAVCLAATTALAADEKPAKVYELRTYKAAPGKLDALNKRFRDHTLGFFKKHGMEVVGFWTPTDEKDGKADTLIYLLAFTSREAADKSWKEFRADPGWQKAKAESEKDGPLTSKVDYVFLTPTDYSADPTKHEAASPCVFELRTYIASPGKLADLNNRFREHTVEIFRRHGMESVGYWVPTGKDNGSDNTLIYLLAHKSRDAAGKSWKDFGADPEWQKVYKESQPDGIPLAAKVTSVYLEPTDYSPVK